MPNAGKQGEAHIQGSEQEAHRTEQPSVAEQRGIGSDVPGDVEMNPQNGGDPGGPGRTCSHVCAVGVSLLNRRQRMPVTRNPGKSCQEEEWPSLENSAFE